MSQFYVGQKVVCVKKGVWVAYPGQTCLRRPAFDQVVTVNYIDTWRGDTYLGFVEMEQDDMFLANNFRPVQEQDLTAQIARDWKETVPVEQEHINEPEPQTA